MLYSERHVQDLIDLGEFKEEDEKHIDVPFYDFESIRVATDNFSDENKLGQGGYGPVYKVISTNIGINIHVYFVLVNGNTVYWVLVPG